MAKIGPWNVFVDNKTYQFVTYDVIGPFPNSAGVYMLLKGTPTAQNRINHEILYIGETDSLQTRLRKGHHDWDEASGLGMNYISIYEVKPWENQIGIQNSLIQNFKPLLNNKVG